MSTGLCIIFNHPFPAQIPLLRELYGSRFDRILFLMPFDRSEQADDVHTVYGGAYGFDQMIASARDAILHRFDGCDAVLFLHNDALLNPAINGRDFMAEFGMDQGSVLALGIHQLCGPLNEWQWSWRAAYNWLYPHALLASGAFSARSYLPSADIAAAQAKAKGFSGDTMIAVPSAETMAAWGAKDPVFQLIRDVIFARADTVDLGYPLFTGYSDMVGVPRALLPEWLHTLGILSSLDLFPEVSIPTANVLTGTRLAGLGRGHQALWLARREAVADIAWVRESFARRDAFIHPVKFNQMAPAYIDALREMYAPQLPAGHCPMCGGACEVGHGYGVA